MLDSYQCGNPDIQENNSSFEETQSSRKKINQQRDQMIQNSGFPFKQKKFDKLDHSEIQMEQRRDFNYSLPEQINEPSKQG